MVAFKLVPSWLNAFHKANYIHSALNIGAVFDPLKLLPHVICALNLDWDVGHCAVFSALLDVTEAYFKLFLASECTMIFSFTLWMSLCTFLLQKILTVDWLSSGPNWYWLFFSECICCPSKGRTWNDPNISLYDFATNHEPSHCQTYPHCPLHLHPSSCCWQKPCSLFWSSK